jgi:hypothetical protein
METVYEKMLKYKKTLNLEKKTKEQKQKDSEEFIVNLTSFKKISNDSLMEHYYKIRKGF